MDLKKIYSDDPLIKYKDTEINPERTKHQIDGVLSEYEVQDIFWHWNQKVIESGEPGEIYVMFKITETIKGVQLKVPARVDCPIIWSRAKPKGRPPRPEQVDWKTSMRAMYHFIYTHLNASYAMQSSKIVAFLGYIQTGEHEQLKDRILPELKQYSALESPEKFNKDHVIETEVVRHE
jgi:hypothetical protein